MGDTPQSQPSGPGGRLRAALGGYSLLARVYRRFRPRWLWRTTSPFGKSTTRYIAENGLTVKRGDFEGMVYPDKAIGKANHLSSKLIGSYEPTVTAFLGERASTHELFVDLGSGDGFFCVGVARLAPLRVLGYEINRYESSLAQQIAEVNGVAIEMRGAVDQTELNSLPTGRLLLLCDLEGQEEDLLDPERVPSLKSTTMMVEIHEQFRPGVSETLFRRFESTHEIRHHSAEEARLEDFPELSDWNASDSKWAAFDGHSPGEGWMSFVPR